MINSMRKPQADKVVRGPGTGESMAVGDLREKPGDTGLHFCPRSEIPVIGLLFILAFALIRALSFNILLHGVHGNGTVCRYEIRRRP